MVNDPVPSGMVVASDIGGSFGVNWENGRKFIRLVGCPDPKGSVRRGGRFVKYYSIEELADFLDGREIPYNKNVRARIPTKFDVMAMFAATGRARKSAAT